MLKKSVTLIYLNAEGISWTNLTSLISEHSQHPRKHLGGARIAYQNRVKQESPDVIPVASPVTSSHESPMTERYWKQHDSILTERMVGKEKGSITESLKINKEMMTGADKNFILQEISLF